MAVRGQVPITNNQALLAAYLKRLQVQGDLGELAISDIVVPVVLVAELEPQGQIPVALRPPFWDKTNIVRAAVLNPAINTVHLDTGQLPAGVYDVFFAANVREGSLKTWAISFAILDPTGLILNQVIDELVTVIDSGTNSGGMYQTRQLSLEIDANERFGWFLGGTGVGATGILNMSIGARLRT